MFYTHQLFDHFLIRTMLLFLTVHHNVSLNTLQFDKIISPFATTLLETYKMDHAKPPLTVLIYLFYHTFMLTC